jgi:peroxiredoxin
MLPEENIFPHMALTPSTMLALGTQAPDFALPDVVTGKTVALKDFAQARALLVMFICRHCPYVVHVCDELARIGRDYADKGAGIVAISSNDATSYPDDAPKKLKEMAIETGFTFPLCHDESQAVAKAYAAACTPDFFLFDAARRLVYRGQLDDTRPGGRAANGHDLRAALDAVLAGRPVNPDQKPSVGCNIKWKPAK